MNMESNIPQKNSNGKTHFLYLKYIILICFYTTVIFTHADTKNTRDSKPFTLTIDLNRYFKGNSVPTTITLTDSGWDITALKQSLTDIVEDVNYSHFRAGKSLMTTLTKKVDALCKESPQLQNCNNFNTQISEIMDMIFEKFYRHLILFPPDYKPIGSQPENFKKTISSLESNKAICESDCTRHNVTMAIRYGTREEYSELRDRLSHSDKQCKKDILTELAEQLKAERLPKDCLRKGNKDHIVCKNILKDINIVQGRVQDLMEMAYSPEEIKSTSAQALCIECESINPQYNNTNEFIKLLDTLEEKSQCADPKPGKEKKVQSGTGKNRTYTVRKEQDGSFSIPLNLSFSAASDYDGPVPKNQVPAHYMKKVQECMKKANTKMLGPNGEKLQFVIQEPTSPGECNGISIEIGSKENRANASKYTSNINCSTITHEVLHLVGLCDEYKEKIIGFAVDSNTGDIKQDINDLRTDPIEDENSVFKLAYDCRVTSMSGINIMSNSPLIWEKVFSNTDSSKNLKSLLTPGQFNSILYGKCSEKNNLFNQCSKLAYTSTVKEGKSCLKKKEECENQNGMGANKKHTIHNLQSRIKEIIEKQDDTKTWKKQSTTRPLGGLELEGIGGLELEGIGRPLLEGIGRPIEPGELTAPMSPEDYQKIFENYQKILTKQLLAPLKKQLSTAESWPDSQ